MSAHLDPVPRHLGRGHGDSDPAGADGGTPLARRRLLTLGGLTVAATASGAVVSACGTSSRQAATPTTASSTTSTTTGDTSTGSTAGDITTLRTASSLEHVLVDAYQALLASPALTDPGIRSTLTDFQGQHAAHAQAFESATTAAGGQAFTTANPVVRAQLVTPALAGLTTQVAVLALAYTLESVASQTHQSSVGTFSRADRNATTASVLGAESRHHALLAVLLQNLRQSAVSYTAYPKDGFQTDAAAVKPGTGTSG